MIKFSGTINSDCGLKKLVGIGFSEMNLHELQKGRPIVFQCSEVQLDDPRKILIVIDDENFRSAMNTLEIDKEQVAFCLVLDDNAIKELRSGHGILNKTKQIDFLFTYGKTEADMEKSLAPYLGENTKITRKGFPPAYYRFEENN